MSVEIERKFIIDSASMPFLENGEKIKQGYFPMSPSVNTVVRIRISGLKAFLTVKGENKGISRREYEYAIPIEDAEYMLSNLCEEIILEKTRYKILVGSHVWEIDVFDGDNKGLVVAEIELSEEDEVFEAPEWVGKEVTGQAKYYNSNLLKNPYKLW